MGCSQTASFGLGKRLEDDYEVSDPAATCCRGVFAANCLITKLLWVLLETPDAHRLDLLATCDDKVWEAHHTSDEVKFSKGGNSAS